LLVSEHATTVIKVIKMSGWLNNKIYVKVLIALFLSREDVFYSFRTNISVNKAVFY